MEFYCEDSEVLVKEEDIKSECSTDCEEDNCDNVIQTNKDTDQMVQSTSPQLPSSVKMEIDIDNDDIEARIQKSSVNSSSVAKGPSITQSSSEADNSLLVAVKKSDVKNIVTWRFVKKFERYRDVHDLMVKQNCWSFVRQCFTEGNLRNYYRCHRISNGNICPVQTNLLFCQTTYKVKMFCTLDQHIHSEATKELIDNVDEDKNLLNLNYPHSTDHSYAVLHKDIDPTPHDVYMNKHSLEQENISSETGSSPNVTLKGKSKPRSLHRDCASENNTNHKPSTSWIAVNSGINSSPLNKISNIADITQSSKDWTFLKQFANEKDGLDFVRSGSCWSYYRMLKTAAVVKKFYQCKQVKESGEKCPAQVCLDVHVLTGKVALFRTCVDHDHDDTGQCDAALISTPGLTEKVKKEIDKFHFLHFTPKSILSNLIQMKGITLPRMSKLKYYLSYLPSLQRPPRKKRQLMKNKNKKVNKKDSTNKMPKNYPVEEDLNVTPDTIYNHAGKPKRCIPPIVKRPVNKKGQHKKNKKKLAHKKDSTNKMPKKYPVEEKDLNVTQYNETIYNYTGTLKQCIPSIMKRRVNKNEPPSAAADWIFEKCFENAEAACYHVEHIEKIWSFWKVKPNLQGMKKFYKCNVKSCKGQCPAMVYLWIDRKKGDVPMYRRKCDHIHTMDISTRAKRIIMRLYKQGLNVTEIMHNLSQTNHVKFKVPTMSQLKLYLDQLSNSLQDTEDQVHDSSTDTASNISEQDYLLEKEDYVSNTISHKSPREYAILPKEPDDYRVMNETITNHSHNTPGSTSNYGIIENYPEKINVLHKPDLTPTQIMNNNARIRDTSMLYKTKKHDEICVKAHVKHIEQHVENETMSGPNIPSPNAIASKLMSQDDTVAPPSFENNLTTSSNITNKRIHSSEDELSDSETRNGEVYKGDYDEIIPLSTITCVNNTESLKPSSKRRKFCQLYKNFESVKAAEQFIEQEKIWSCYEPREARKGVHKYYRCNQFNQEGRITGIPCPAKLYIKLTEDKSSALIWHLDSRHNHEYRSCTGIDNKVKTAITKLYNQKLEPNAMMNELAKINDMPLLTMNELLTCLNDLTDGKNKYIAENKVEFEDFEEIEESFIEDNGQKLIGDSASQTCSPRITDNGLRSVRKHLDLKTFGEPQTSHDSKMQKCDLSQVTSDISLNNESWVLKYKFLNVGDAYNYVRTNSWSFLQQQVEEEGTKKYYICNQTADGSHVKCPAGIYLLVTSEVDIVLLFESTSQHNHALLTPSTIRNDKVDDKIKEPLTKENSQTVLPEQINAATNTWVFYYKFSHASDAYDYVKNGSWSFTRQCIDTNGVKRYYRCNRVTSRGNQCCAQIYLFLESLSEAVLIYKTLLDHDHDLYTNISYGFTDKTKEVIDKFHDLHHKPKAIMNNLAKIHGIVLPKMSQLLLYLQDRERYKNTIADTKEPAHLTNENNGERYRLLSTESNTMILPTERLEDKSQDNEEDTDGYITSDDELRAHAQIKNQLRYGYFYTNWKLIKVFENVDDAKKFIDNRGSWKHCRTQVSKEEVKKKIYRCVHKSRKGYVCPAQMSIVIEPALDKVGVYRKLDAHNHQRIRKDSKPMADINTLQKDSGKSHENTDETKLDLTTNKDFNDRVCEVSLGELENWLKLHSTVPKSKHNVFVIGYEMPAYSLGDKLPKFSFVLSTKYLLNLACNAKVLHADTRYKFSWQGFAVYVVGCSDKNKTFHPLALQLTSYEHGDNFKIMFASMNRFLDSFYGRVMRPEAIVFDGDESTFTDVWSHDLIVRTCWALVRQKIENKVKKIVNKRHQDEVLEDIYYLQASTDKIMHDVASKAFMKKWDNETAFIDYFDKRWLIKSRHWYLGAHVGSPDNNGVLKTFVSSIQKEDIFRDGLSLSEFLNVAKQLVNKWSLEMRQCAEFPTLCVTQWVEAYQWSRDKPPMRFPVHGYYTCYNSGDPKIFTVCNFNDCKKQFFSYWQVKLPQKDWQRGWCSCQTFHKEYVCKHVLGLAIIQKLVIPPDVVLESPNIGMLPEVECLPTLPQKRIMETQFARIVP